MITAGRNEIEDTLTLMKLRKLYLTDGYPIRNAIAIPQSLNMDFTFIKPMYGRIDLQSDSVTNCSIKNNTILEKANLANFSNSNNMAFNFVVDAFTELQRFFFSTISTKPGYDLFGPLGSINPIKGWESPLTGYDNHIDNLYNDFINSAITIEKQNTVLTFNDFIKLYLEYIDSKIINFPFTYSGFIVSRFVTPRCSGLVVDIADEDFGNDYIKTSNYINNTNFMLLEESTARFGFFIDRNAPWRIVANVRSKYMLEKASKYGIKKTEDIFTNKFVKNYKLDIQLLQKHLLTIYNKFVIDNPMQVLVKNPYCIENNLRTVITAADLKNFMPNIKLLKLYCFLRARELYIDLGQEQFNRILSESFSLLNTQNMDVAVKFINDKFNGYKSQTINQNYLTPKEASATVNIQTESKFFNKVKISL